MSQVNYDNEELHYDSDSGRLYFVRDNSIYYPSISPLPEGTDDEVSSSDDDMEYEWFVPQTPVQEKKEKIPQAPKKSDERLVHQFETLSVSRKLF